MEPVKSHFDKLINSFESSVACNDSDYNQSLFYVLKDAVFDIMSPCGTASAAWSLAIWSSPIVDKKDGRLMAIYASADDLERGRRTIGKPGKLLRKLAPMASDSDCAKFSEIFKDTFVTPLQGMVVKSGKLPEDFARVYTQKQAPKGDPRLGHEYKSLSASCMRYPFDHLAAHPVTIFGSGDFEIVWVENAKGELLARAVVATLSGRYSPAPIYTNSNAASEMLQSHLAKANAASQRPDCESWVNCKLLKISSGFGGESYLGPYLDQYQSVKESSCGEYFRICSSTNSELMMDSTEGTVGGHDNQCESCACGLHDDEIFFCESGETVLCESCYEDSHYRCSSCDDMAHNDDSFDVVGGEPICEYCLYHGSYVETSEGVCLVDDTVFCEESDEYFHIDSGDFFTCAEGEIRANSLKAPVTIDCTFDQAIQWYIITTKRDENERIVSTFTLKPWFEYSENESGETVITTRQLELFDSESDLGDVVDCDCELCK
tara:strand:- start:344 stop:1816 length:1473 start_codon:yes stop_codon:yes gene_type:complete